MLYPSDEFVSASGGFALAVYKHASPNGLLFLDELSSDVIFDDLVFLLSPVQARRDHTR